jgi:5,10-methenyltetrahydromethanopterin hydrogenase
MSSTADRLAARILAASGAGGISDLHRAASLARELRRPEIAETLAEIAEAAENQLIRRLEVVF